MKRTIVSLGLTLALLAAFGLALTPQQAAPKPDLAKVLGTWSLDIDTGGMVITLTLVLEAPEGKLAGKISEPNGMFTDSPLANIEFDGDNLAYDISVASPPDGAVKTWKTQLKVAADTAEGAIANADTGMTANVSGKRVQK
ncbi:MAG TPA: hypothetical protein VMS75_11625 [Terriglobales bacterium]|nr:hypothetical protein [Terriglobales bacterium]